MAIEAFLWQGIQEQTQIAVFHPAGLQIPIEWQNFEIYGIYNGN
jgi:hypothetical protein